MNRNVWIAVLSGIVVVAAWPPNAVAGTLRVVRSIALPPNYFSGKGLAWDGEHLWTVATKEIYEPPLLMEAIAEVDPTDGSVLSETIQPSFLGDFAHDGVNLWYTWSPSTSDTWAPGSPPDTHSDYVYRRDAAGRSWVAFQPHHSPDAKTIGAAWDGTSLWFSDRKHQEVFRVDPADGTVLISFASPAVEPLGLAWGANHLWSVDAIDKLIYQFDTAGNVVDRWSSPVIDPWGLTFDGEYLWLIENDTWPCQVVQLAIPEPSSLALLAVGGFGLAAFSARRDKRSVVGASHFMHGRIEG